MAAAAGVVPKEIEKKDKKDADEIERGRLDKTEKLPAIKRRLDSIATLIAGRTQCAAIAIINNELYVSSNNLSKRVKEDNKFVQSAMEILTYFHRLANDEPIPEEKRRAVFIEICSPDWFSNLKRGGGVNLSDEIS